MFIHEFTIPFNPGNSGGPVIDANTGEVFALVQSFTTYQVGERVLDIKNKKLAKELGYSKYLQIMSTNYSRAYSLCMFEKAFREHGII